MAPVQQVQLRSPQGSLQDTGRLPAVIVAWLALRVCACQEWFVHEQLKGAGRGGGGALVSGSCD